MHNLQTQILREKIIKSVRNFFYQQNFHEVIVPVLNDTVPLEPNLYPFVTTWNTRQQTKKYFLPMSPERGLKMMLAQGIGNCFAISPSFRNLENAGPLHTPEFLMLEWYRENADYKMIIEDVKSLINVTQKALNMPQMYNRLNDWSSFSLINLFKRYLKLDLIEIVSNDKKLFKYGKERGYQTNRATWDQLYDQVFVSEIEPHLPKEPCFLIDFPARISPLCKPQKEKSYFAERFELYINRIELANGNTENTDVESIKKTLRKPLDNEFLNSLKKMQNASYAGVGLGIDRLSMIFSNTSNLSSL